MGWGSVRDRQSDGLSRTSCRTGPTHCNKKTHCAENSDGSGIEGVNGGGIDFGPRVDVGRTPERGDAMSSAEQGGGVVAASAKRAKANFENFSTSLSGASHVSCGCFPHS